MENLLAGLASQLTRNCIKSYEMHKPYSPMCSRSSNLPRPHMSLNRSSSRRLLPNLSNARRVLMSALSCTNLKRPFPGRSQSSKQAFFRCLCTSALHARLVLHPFVLQLRDLRSRDRLLELRCPCFVGQEKAEGTNDRVGITTSYTLCIR